MIIQYKFLNLLFYIDEQKIDKIEKFISNIVDKYFSNVAGGVVLMLLIIIVLFSLISNSSRNNR